MMKKKVAILGSSGGNLYSLGGKEPEKLLGELLLQLEESTEASLYGWDERAEEPYIKLEGTLKEINEEAVKADLEISEKIENGEIDGLIFMSADPNGANKKAVEAAAKMKLPATGTGGTSMATISSKGINVISTSGTTGTTNRTRAVTFVTSLSKHWGIS